jgi:Predicted transcriptional regulators
VNVRGQHLKGHLDMLLLAAIAGGAEHGYAIAETLRRASDGAVDLQDGTIYPALHRLRRAGLVDSHWSEGDGRRRRVYALTRRGRIALDAQRDDWLQFERAVRRVFALIAS